MQKCNAIACGCFHMIVLRYCKMNYLVTCIHSLDTCTHTHTHSLTHALTYTHTHTHTHSHTHTHTHTLHYIITMHDYPWAIPNCDYILHLSYTCTYITATAASYVNILPFQFHYQLRYHHITPHHSRFWISLLRVFFCSFAHTDFALLAVFFSGPYEPEAWLKLKLIITNTVFLVG